MGSCYTNTTVRGRSSVGRTPDLHSGGQRFDSARLHQNMTFTDKLKLAYVTYEQYADWIQCMVDPAFYDRLDRQHTLVWKHIYSTGAQLENNMQHSESKFIASYNNIKDPTWPSINTFQQFKQLPDRIKQECVSHGLSLSRWKQNIVKGIYQRDKDQRLVMCIPVIKLVMENLQYIKNKNVMLFNDTNGKISGAILHNQCQSVIVMAQQKNLDLLQYNLNTYFADKNFTCYDMNQPVDESVDTVIITTDSFRWNNPDFPAVSIHDVLQFNPQHIIVEYDRKINDTPLDVDTPTVKDYNLIHKHTWTFQLTDHKQIEREMHIYQKITK